MLEFDNRLMAIAAKGQEPVLKQLRLAWWREQLSKPAESRPKGEPLLAQLAGWERQEALEASLHELINAWEMLIVNDEAHGHATIAEANRMRADAVFAGYALWADPRTEVVEQAKKAGLLWAQASLGRVSTNEPLRLVRGLKPLNLLLMATDMDAQVGGISRVRKFLRLNWHALTGW